MGRDKSRLRLGSRTLLQQIRSEAKRTGLPVRIVKKDIVPRCGPLGGIYTALKRCRAENILFLPCDMPFLRAETLKWTINQFEKLCVSTKEQRRSATPSLFLAYNRKAGFPFILSKPALPIVERQIRTGQFSLQNLWKRLHAKIIPPPRRWRSQLNNINTPKDWSRARAMLLADSEII